MPIISTNVNLAGQSGVKPSFIFIDTNDTVGTVTTAGYLNILVDQGTPFSNSDVAVVTTRPSISSHDITASVYSISFSGGDWTLTAIGGGGGGSIVLPTTANHIATYTDTAGTLSEDAPTAVNAGNIQAGLSGTAGTLTSFPSTSSEGSLIIQAADVSAGDFSSTITNSASLTQSKVYTLPNTQNFTDPPTICAVDNSGAPTSGHLAVWSFGGAGGLSDGGAVPTAVIIPSSTSNITSGTLTTLSGNGISLVQNPGFYGFLVNFVIINFTYASVAYTGTTGNFYISYDVAGTKVASTLVPQSAFAATSNQVFIMYSSTALSAIDRSDIYGKDLYFVTDNNMASGNSGINVTVYYTAFNIL